MVKANNNLLENFFKDDSQNIDLYNNWIKNGDECSLKMLNRKFKDYLFEIYFCSYIVKSINYKALELKRNKNKIANREALTLNVLEHNFNEERINLIASPTTDLLEEIHQDIENMELDELIYNQKIIKTLKELPSKQRLILFKHVIENKEEKLIAKELGVSVQAVNKNKNKALTTIRKKLGVV